MSGQLLLYGATGYTGRLLAHRFQSLAQRGSAVDLILGGRDREKLDELAGRLGLPRSAFPLDEPAEIDDALAGVRVVLNAAGPFRETAGPLMDACIRNGVHYLDLAGEWRVFMRAMDRSAAAAAAGVMLMPGVGFTIVAGDCLMRHAAEAVEKPVSLRLAFSWPSVVSPGTAMTTAACLEPLALTKRKGKLAAVPLGRVARAFDFGRGLKNATLVNLPEVVTGEFTTGVDTIEAYLEVTDLQRVACVGLAAGMALGGSGPLQAAAEMIGARSHEPSLEARKAARYDVVVEATDAWRRVRTFRMRTLDGYSVTLATAPYIVQQVLTGGWEPGFQTPALLFGSDFLWTEREGEALHCAALDPSLSPREV